MKNSTSFYFTFAVMLILSPMTLSGALSNEERDGFVRRRRATDGGGESGPVQRSLRSLAPLGDRILIRKAVKETKTAEGILLPADKAKESNEGTVIAVGPGKRDISGILHAPTLKAGDTVLLPKNGGIEIEIGGEKFTLFSEDDILGKFD